MMGFSKPSILPLICIVVSLVLVLLTFFLPWYSTGITGGDVEMNANIYLDRSEMKFLGQTVKSSNEGVDFIQNTMYLTIITFIVCIIALIGTMGFVIKSGFSDKMKKIGIAFGIITCIFAVITIIYYMSETINVISESSSTYFAISGQENIFTDIGFWWSEDIGGAHISAGPGFSWYFMIFSGILAFVSSVILIIKKEPKQTTPLSPSMESQAPPVSPPMQ